MKERFDKYWGKCNMIMAIGAILDPRLRINKGDKENINKVRDVLNQLYSEYVKMNHASISEESGDCGRVSNPSEEDSSSSSMFEHIQIVRNGELVEPLKYEPDVYLDDGLYNANVIKFDALTWWKEKCSKT
ncbi:Zinc finger BED domain-containing protein RICESLEEPER 1 [Bienertia sinuspersici]